MSAYIDGEGNLRWPAEQDRRDELASEMLGAELASHLDYWFELARDLIRNPEASAKFRREHNWEAAEPFRRAFAAMNPEQRGLVEKLLWDTASGVLFSTLVTLDQFPGGIVDVVVRDSATDEPLANISDAGVFELHDRFHGWLDKYSSIAADYESGGGEGEG